MWRGTLVLSSTSGGYEREREITSDSVNMGLVSSEESPNFEKSILRIGNTSREITKLYYELELGPPPKNMSPSISALTISCSRTKADKDNASVFVSVRVFST